MTSKPETQATLADDYAAIRREVLVVFPDAACGQRGPNNYAIRDAAKMLLGCGSTPDMAWADAWDGLSKAGRMQA